MCGIAGIIDNAPKESVQKVLAQMNQTICHRGPDGEGIYLTITENERYTIGLAHRRLAIIDLVSGEQPMQSPDGEITLIFNGEIYNFQSLREELILLGQEFHTTSDTEVLLIAYRVWGAECVKRLRGMFAFALWDAMRQELLLARDHFGKKPLFIWQKEQTLVFGSEIKAILTHPAVAAKWDDQSVLDYLQYRYVPGPNTLFDGIIKLDPGSYAIWNAGNLTTKSYYLPPDGTEKPTVFSSSENALITFTNKLDECVRLRMISDVPFGAFLSGGLDSSAIVALMTRHTSQPVNTFSIGFKEDVYSETNYARLIADKFQTNHHELTIVADDIIRLLPKVIAYNDAPMAEPTDIAIYVLATEAAKSVKMVLTGEGADEVLAGYPKHKYEPYSGAYRAIVPEAIHNKVVMPLAEKLPYEFSRIITLINSFGLRPAEERLPRWFGAINLAERDRLSVLQGSGRRVSKRPFAVMENQTALRRILYFDQTSWLPDNLLQRGDRMTMAASIEARMPFMDYELAALVSSYPDKYRINGGTQKWLLREAMKQVLPEVVLKRQKVGFRVPVNLWFRTTLKNYVYEHLLGPESQTKEFYDRSVLQAMLDEHVNGRRNHEKLIWALLNLELFQKHYRLA